MAMTKETNAIPSTPQEGVSLAPGADSAASFEELMKERNRQRKEREEVHVAELKVQISQLEAALAAETKRRVDACKHVEHEAQNMVKELEDRLKAQLKEDNEKLNARVAALEDRLTALEAKQAKDFEYHLEKVNTKSKEMNDSLQSLQQLQEQEHQSRTQRDSRLLHQLGTYASDMQARWNEEREARIAQVAALEQKMQSQDQIMSSQQRSFHSKIESELTALQKELEAESAERQAEDEAIVAALNQYTEQLQHSLSILSSD